MARFVKLSLSSALLCGALVACSETDGTLNGPVATPTPVVSTTSEVLQTAQQLNDTAEPFAVNNGAFSFNDTAEDTQPQAINNTP